MQQESPRAEGARQNPHCQYHHTPDLSIVERNS